ncbi:MAG: hypothetical protein M0R33_13975 [Methylomonas sp.]|jgi:DNA topoisomerase-2|uniref:DNA gyrase subunit A n=1 Tax=Methylomonas sp. TaxID=418 RepID=UPI0025CC8F3B|nr:DNA gyrase subunit A [Methylomonas sp.]MCK9607544.1 hypothetical protein [Methylomonas sp.]
MADSAQQIEDKYPIIDISEHVRDKDMWAGSKNASESQELVFTVAKSPQGSSDAPPNSRISAVAETLLFSPCAYKCLDEPIVNALDHFVRCNIAAKNGKKVTIISANICLTGEHRGEIEIRNDGAGIEIAFHNKAQMYVPQLIFGELFRGCNIHKDNASDITGGTNGIGVKLTNIHSTRFCVETADDSGQVYSQTWENHMRVCGKPIITRRKKGAHETGTRLIFTLDYGELNTMPETAGKLLMQRMIFAALYVRSFAKNQCSVYFGDICVSDFTAEELAASILGAERIHSAIMKPKVGGRMARDDKFTWTIFAAANRDLLTSSRAAISVVNGIIVPIGNHIDKVFSIILEGVRKECKKDALLKEETIITPALLRGVLSLLIVARVGEVGWSGQSKDKLTLPKEILAGYDEIPAKYLQPIVELAHVAILERFVKKSQRTTIQHSKEIELPSSKYNRAISAGTREAHKCRLLTVEGDSAMSQIRNGITRILKPKYYGAMSMGGVIMNARRICPRISDTSALRLLRKEFLSNQFVAAFIAAVGLDFSLKYETPEEMKHLKYGGVIACVDQDYDGIGNIFGLLINLFAAFWPALIENGFIQRLSTPIQRAYPKNGGEVLEFYSDREVEDWRAIAGEAGEAKYNIKYYKGLGTHSTAEMLQIFNHFADHLFRFKFDATAEHLFEVYYGEIPQLRREQLSLPCTRLPSELLAEIEKMKIIPCSIMLTTDVDVYQRDNLERKINSAIDGFNQSGRKVFHGIVKAFKKKSTAEMRVSQLAGAISLTENYHHGEMSLEKSITKKAFLAPGGCQLPILVPLSMFGSRLMGGKDASSPRYVHTRPNTRLNQLLFPMVDYPLLEFNFDEGKQVEPKYYVPILPIAILESAKLPAHGWGMAIWAREVMDVISLVRAKIVGAECGYLPLRPCCFPTAGGRREIEAELHFPAQYYDDTFRVITSPADGEYAHARCKWKGIIISKGGEEYSIGKYEIRGESIVITELPLRVWTMPYIEMLGRRHNADVDASPIEKIANNSDMSDVRIEIKLKPDGLAQILTMPRGNIGDPIIEFFLLRNKLQKYLNFVQPDLAVREFKSYREVADYWFPFRRDLYARRIEREVALMELKEKYYSEIIRYIDAGIEAKKYSDDELETILNGAQFVRFNRARLFEPGFLRTRDELRAEIIGGKGASFEYLISLADKNKTIEGRKKYDTLLRDTGSERRTLQARAALPPFTAAQIWLDELDALEVVINDGRATDWLFGDKELFKFTTK